jgi:hypothetical protein
MAVFNATKEKKKLEGIIKDIPEDKKKLVEGLIADASFMAEQLEVLRTYIAKNGWSEEYQNGANQRGKKTSVEADMYVKVQKAYQSIIRQLNDFIPTETAPKGDELLDFMND